MLPNFQSWAVWPDGSLSSDNHDTAAQAQAVVQRLQRQGMGGDGKTFPKAAGVQNLVKWRLSPERFVWEKYCGKQAFSIAMLARWPTGFSCELQPGVRLIGFCEADRIRVRNRAEGYVLLVEIEGEETWFHTIILPDLAKQEGEKKGI